jgi:hypothetical protein
MRLTIDGKPREFIPIKAFRAEYGLPPTFGVALFEPKEWEGLGRIDRAGAELNSVRAAVLAALPAALPPSGWLAFLPDLSRRFEAKLWEINPQVGLKDVEIEFAVGGFSDVCQAMAYALLRAGAAGDPAPDFQQVYADWLDNSTRVFSQIHAYSYQGEAWQVQTVAHAYGRAGLRIQTPSTTHYVHDAALGCPAEGFMAALLAEVCGRMLGLQLP